MKQVFSYQFLATGLGLLTLLAFFQVLGGQFITYDDYAFIVDNPHVRTGLSWDNIIWSFTHYYSGTWQPLVWISYMLDAQLYGLKPWGFHLTNMIFHLANVFLLFAVLRQMTGSTYRSAFVAALFAVHPLNVETVAWIGERKGLMCVTFGLLCLLAYSNYARTRSPKDYLLALLCLGLAFMCKPVLMPLPFALLLLDYWPLQRKESFKILVLEKIPMLVLVAIYGYFAFCAQKAGGAVVSTDTFPLSLRFSNAVVSYGTYLLKTFAPYNLALIYPPILPVPLWKTLTSATVLLGVSGIALRYAKQAPYLLVGWLWFLGMLVPVIGILKINLQAMAERYAYFPLIGLFIILAWGTAALAQKFRLPAKLLTTLSACFLTILLSITLLQVGYWDNSVTLFEYNIQSQPHNPIAHQLLGEQYRMRSQNPLALHHFNAAISLQPNYVPAYNSKAFVLIHMKQTTQALDTIAQSLAINPQNYVGLSYRGFIKYQQGNPEQALADFELALKIKPDFEQARKNAEQLRNTLQNQHNKQ